MEANRVIVKKYFEKGKTGSQIFQLVKSIGIKRDFIYRTLRRLSDTGSLNDRPRSGRKRTVCTPDRIKRVREKIRRNPGRSGRQLAKDENVDRESMRRILRNELGLMPYRKRKIHGLTAKQRLTRVQRCKQLLKRHGGKKVEKIIFSDEKLFVMQQAHNPKNDVVYSVSIQNIPEHLLFVQRFQNTSAVMVWGGISHKGKLPLIFIDRGVKINTEYYKTFVLESTLKPEADKLFPKKDWIFQQDSAPAHASNITQQWCRENCPNFISKDLWPPSSPDLNPLDYFVWGVLEAKVNATQHRNLDSMKAAIQREWTNLSMESVRAAINGWQRRLTAIIEQDGGRIE